ncbi:hypothetical protein BMS3Abin15_00564 [bacterium BMS3Abin15]|nr:hypothetical protein BMS3Abin15_00564 [bacterium BMS3Abin15]
MNLTRTRISLHRGLLGPVIWENNKSPKQYFNYYRKAFIMRLKLALHTELNSKKERKK